MSKGIESFDDMGLGNNLLRGIYAFGIETPSAVQKVAIPAMVEGDLEQDVFVESGIGSGKSTAAVIAVLKMIDINFTRTQAVIVTANERACRNVMLLLSEIGMFLKGFEAGTHVQVVSGKKVELGDHVKVVVFDDVDVVVEDLVQGSTGVKIVMFGKKGKEYGMIKISVEDESLSGEQFNQFHLKLENEKVETVFDLIENAANPVIIFVNSRGAIEDLGGLLTKGGYAVSVLHDDMTPAEEEEVLVGFRTGGNHVLLCTDEFIGGILCVQHSALVLNFDFPMGVEIYERRIRCGKRMGSKGVAISFVCGEKEGSRFREVENTLGVFVAEVPMSMTEMI
eukprot:TRINITY_DN3127_c0_g2_i1.p1 TRINITY_DN3127_c0_g2~~TRINITY_DN3127_c0_g2_i1.p1  ORF type:complete len:366 (+),score=86.44 TRINITY_DN3127_c0_g2_i1:85-1098(+)